MLSVSFLLSWLLRLVHASFTSKLCMSACDRLQTWQMILRGDNDAKIAVEFVYRDVGRVWSQE